MIIGLIGQAQSGKDTVGQYLVENYDFERKAFADILKDAVASLWGITREQVDEFKFNEGTLPNVEVILDIKGKNQYSFTWREHLQRFGTEMGREVFGSDFWVDLVFKEIRKHKNYVFTDCRFENEAARIYFAKGYNIRLIRPGFENEENHISETQKISEHLIARTILNSGTLDDLYASVDASLTELGELNAAK